MHVMIDDLDTTMDNSIASHAVAVHQNRAAMYEAQEYL